MSTRQCLDKSLQPILMYLRLQEAVEVITQHEVEVLLSKRTRAQLRTKINRLLNRGKLSSSNNDKGRENNDAWDIIHSLLQVY
jgi:hypothetical protein